MAVTTDLKFFLSRCEREFTQTEIILTATDPLHAEGLCRYCVDLAKWAIETGRDWVIVRWAGDAGKPYRIPSWYATRKGANTKMTNEINNVSNAEIERIAGSDYLRVYEQMKEWRSQGLIVTVTDMMTNHCLHVNDLQAPDRGGG